MDGIPSRGPSPQSELKAPLRPVSGKFGDKTVTHAPGSRTQPPKPAEGFRFRTLPERGIKPQAPAVPTVDNDLDDGFQDEVPVSHILHKRKRGEIDADGGDQPAASALKQLLQDEGYISGDDTIQPAQKHLPAAPSDAELFIDNEPTEDGDQLGEITQKEKGIFKSLLSGLGKFAKSIWQFAKDHKLQITMVLGIALGLALMFATGGAAAPGVLTAGLFAFSYIMATTCFFVLMMDLLTLNNTSSGGQTANDGQAKNNQKVAKKNANQATDDKKTQDEKDLAKGKDSTFRLKPNNGKNSTSPQANPAGNQAGQTDDGASSVNDIDEAEATSSSFDNAQHPFNLDKFDQWLDESLGKLTQTEEFQKFKDAFPASDDSLTIEDPEALEASLQEVAARLEAIKDTVHEPLEQNEHTFANQAGRIHQLDNDMNAVLSALRPKAQQCGEWITKLIAALPKDGNWLPVDLHAQFLSISPLRNRLPDMDEAEWGRLEATDLTRNVYKALFEYQEGVQAASGLATRGVTPTTSVSTNETEDVASEEIVNASQKEGVKSQVTPLDGDGRWNWDAVKGAAKDLTDTLKFKFEKPENVDTDTASENGSTRSRRSSTRSSSASSSSTSSDELVASVNLTDELAGLKKIKSDWKSLKKGDPNVSIWQMVENDIDQRASNLSGTERDDFRQKSEQQFRRVKSRMIKLGQELYQCANKYRNIKQDSSAFDVNNLSILQARSVEFAKSSQFMSGLMDDIISVALYKVIDAQDSDEDGALSLLKAADRRGFIDSIFENQSVQEKLLNNDGELDATYRQEMLGVVKSWLNNYWVNK